MGHQDPQIQNSIQSVKGTLHTEVSTSSGSLAQYWQYSLRQTSQGKKHVTNSEHEST